MDGVMEKLKTLKMVMTDPRLRELMGKEIALVEKGDAYGERVDQKEFDSLMEEVLTTELNRKKLLVLLTQEPSSVETLSEKTGLPPDEVFRSLLVLQRKGLVQLERVERKSPIYRAMEE